MSRSPEPNTVEETDNNTVSKATPRLVLTQIELLNFKSYYGRRVIGPFHTRFSAIVGPNGSGKSNVIDALLFVFGRRAKQIRLKKISELVHTSENHRNCKQARVNVYFQEIVDSESSSGSTGDDCDEYKLVPNSQFVISRVATKRSKSQYFINDKAVAFREVSALLLSKHIDLNNNRFLILQGEVESIAMMKPKGVKDSDDGLLEYLEDIIGTNQYVLQIDRASEQVELLENEVQERLNRVCVVERDRDKLSDAKGEAEQYIKSQLQLMKLQGLTKQISGKKWEYKLSSLQEQSKKITQELEIKKDAQAEITQELQTIESQYSLILTEKEKLSKEWKKAQNTFQEYEQQDVALHERMKYLKKEMGKIKKNRSNLELQKEQNLETISSNESLIPQLQEKTSGFALSLEEESEKQERMMNELSDKTQPIKEKMEEKQKELMPLKDFENQIKQQMNSINDDIFAIESKAENAKKRKQDITERVSDIESEIMRKTADISHAQTEMERMKSDALEFETEMRRLQSEQERIRPLIPEAQKKLSMARYAFENAGNKHRISQALMEAQQRSDLSGILGRLGDLGSIDSKYDVAASTAGTGPLNYIVVDKTHHAQRAVEYLKRHNLGRATMLILEKQKHLRSVCRRAIETPSNVDRLFDLISVKEDKFREAFYFAFRDTLVAPNLDDANRLAFSGGKRWRVVTLQGQLIETSGAMTGGGKRVHRGLMSDRIIDCEYSAEDIDKLDISYRDLMGNEQSIGRSLRDVYGKVNGCKKAKDKAQKFSQKLDVEWKGLQQRKQALMSQIPEITTLGTISDDDHSQLLALEERKLSVSRSFDGARRNCELLEEDIANLEDSILMAGGNELREQKGKVDKLKSLLKETEKRVTQLSVEIEKCNKALAMSANKLSQCSGNYAEMKDEYDSSKSQKRELTDCAAEVLDLVERKKGEFEAKEVEWNKLSQIVEKQQSLLTKLTKDMMSLSESEASASYECKKLSQMNKKMANDIDNLRERFVRHKKQFLDLDDDSAMDVDSDNDNAMDVDTDNAMETSSTSDVDLNAYLSESTLSFKLLAQTQLEQIDLSVIDADISQIRKDIDDSKVNMGAIEAWRNKDFEYVERLQDLQSCKSNRDEQRKHFEDLKTARFDSFMNGFSEITGKLKEMYRMLTCGGDAELELVDSIDPFSEGVQFSVRPPKKSWKNISNLSGGEKTLSSMALVFALHHYKPTPLYVMDEIDAALDFKNVSIVANYIHRRTKNAQFVIISLRNNMFDLANRLVGIYKTDNASKSITIDPKLFSIPGGTTGGTSTDKSNVSDQMNEMDINGQISKTGKETETDESQNEKDRGVIAIKTQNVV